MATINGLSTLAVADVTTGDYLPIYDGSAGTDKKTPLFAQGSWTPTLKFGGATTGITYSAQVGSYTRIGGIVLISATIVLSSKGSATGAATITGLPYSSLNNASSQFYIGNMYWRSMAANGYSIMSTLPDNSSTIALYVSTSGANTTAATDANFGNGSEIIFSMMYEV